MKNHTEEIRAIVQKFINFYNEKYCTAWHPTRQSLEDREIYTFKSKAAYDDFYLYMLQEAPNSLLASCAPRGNNNSLEVTFIITPTSF